ncbi:MurR/RpiR family transcriptional regulator [Dellaglioa carnosa]|uniref:MurR/RpiR family transcriptional regulator n=1 Tax=Dellaglioa carnosa TaxID=2995136 RepID=A0ABT4JMG4_9LACO|nr:MurR/RpiR family transcriptional regulator [Dellaglioa carnosa]MCZ2491544.1 MurR/RpiR family transcriptional regulator [Dellaglioa carnosa]MCZ2494621.1 MurR/RpiR family transcriptional regulator [Dellaglioa carnosa]MDK1731484.1 MurR/RpiR family transcriptional regulator [Dellaglioa carnosa]
MENKRLNLIYKLNHIVNELEIGTVEYELAKFFLGNFKSANKWNIYDIAEENNVSRASVRRFAKQLGYKNFLEMKKYVQEFDDGIEEFQKFYGVENFLDKLVTNIEVMMKELSVRLNTQEVDCLNKMINEHDEVIIFTSSNIAGLVKTFQQRMIIFGKKVTLLTELESLKKFKNVKNPPLIIVFSISGLLLSTILLELRQIDATKVLFTNNRNPVYNQDFDKLYHLSSQHYEGDMNDVLYYTYGINFVLDLLFNGYLLKYKTGGI